MSLVNSPILAFPFHSHGVRYLKTCLLKCFKIILASNENHVPAYGYMNAVHRSTKWTHSIRRKMMKQCSSHWWSKIDFNSKQASKSHHKIHTWLISIDQLRIMSGKTRGGGSWPWLRLVKSHWQKRSTYGQDFRCGVSEPWKTILAFISRSHEILRKIVVPNRNTQPTVSISHVTPMFSSQKDKHISDILEKSFWKRISVYKNTDQLITLNTNCLPAMCNHSLITG